jgi:hypothetical protein
MHILASRPKKRSVAALVPPWEETARPAGQKRVLILKRGSRERRRGRPTGRMAQIAPCLVGPLGEYVDRKSLDFRPFGHLRTGWGAGVPCLSRCDLQRSGLLRDRQKKAVRQCAGAWLPAAAGGERGMRTAENALKRWDGRPDWRRRALALCSLVPGFADWREAGGSRRHRFGT